MSEHKVSAELGAAREDAQFGFEGERQLAFEFTGDAQEYFRIWIVNLSLTLVTFGLFSPWAKVRKKRYFYSHTLLDGSPFQYLGKPIPILKGRLVAAALVVTWWAVAHLVPEFAILLFVAGAVLLPWVVVRSAAFNARYSAYRNMTFRFAGTYWSFVRELIGSALLTVVTCYLAFPWLRARFTRYLVSRTSFGGVPAQFFRVGGDLAASYLISYACMVGTVGSSIVLFKAFHSPVASVKALQNITYVAYVAYFLVFVFLKARIDNIVWTGTGLGGLSFESTLRFRELLWVYFSNSVAVLCSAGLLVPWAVIRVAKYRAAHFGVVATGSLAQFQGSDRSAVQATGAEVGEFFDLDLSL